MMNMKTGEVIPFDRSRHLLKKAKELLADTSLFFSNTDKGVSCLLDAFPYCHSPMKLKIMPLLGYAGKDRVLKPLFDIVIKPDQDEQIRFSAALQLGTAASLSMNPSTITMLLIDSLDFPEPSVRSNCALALGWEGNQIAVNPLMEHLNDRNRDVQVAVVTALSAIGGISVFTQLTDLLTSGNLEEKRSVLLNLWRFVKYTPQVEMVYVNNIDLIESELKVDLISGMGMIPLSDRIIDIYRRLLSENDSQMGVQILTNLTAYNPIDYKGLKDRIVELAGSGEVRIRQLATRLLSQQK